MLEGEAVTKVILAVLVFAPTAWANCACVMWYTYQPLGDDATTRAHSGSETRQACMAALSGEITRLEKVDLSPK
jgi:hypothetical protein